MTLSLKSEMRLCLLSRIKVTTKDLNRVDLIVRFEPHHCWELYIVETGLHPPRVADQEPILQTGCFAEIRRT